MWRGEVGEGGVYQSGVQGLAERGSGGRLHLGHPVHLTQLVHSHILLPQQRGGGRGEERDGGEEGQKVGGGQGERRDRRDKGGGERRVGEREGSGARKGKRQAHQLEERRRLK